MGVGYTDFMKNSGVSTLALALQAIHAACDDAGISFKQLDGVATHRVGDSVQGAVVLNALGMVDPKFYVDQFGGGSASHTVVGQAAMAVATGVRAESCTTPVPSLMRSVWAASQVSGVNASEPQDSAVQTESKPQSSASLVSSTMSLGG